MTANNIYVKKSKDYIYSPFSFELEPIKRLLLIDFSKDKDRIYYCFELQYFDDSINGKGIRIIGYRNDKFIDVYQQPGLFKKIGFDQVANGLANIFILPMEDAVFEINDYGVDVNFKINDVEKRTVEVKIKEKSKKKTNPFNILAPLGEDTKNPFSLPIYFMNDFYLVRKKKTEILIKINSEEHSPDSFQIPLDCSTFYFSRYSSDPFFVHFNNSFNGVLKPLQINEKDEIQSDNLIYKIGNNNGNYEIKEISIKDKNHKTSIDFNPAFPDILSINDDLVYEGNFSISSGKTTGSIKGIYKIENKNGDINIIVIPNRGWIPNEKRLSIKFMFKFAKVFTDWPKSYIWEANIKIKKSNVNMESSWKRIKKEALD